jgi:hypothetical protein
MWLQTADQMGLPLHIIEGATIVHSFGAPIGDSPVPINPFTSERVLATDRSGHLFSGKYYDYEIEVWTDSGRRLTGFKGPVLNRSPVLPGRFSPENPPPNRIFALRADDPNILWLITWRRRENWRDALEEQVLPNGDVRLVPKSGSYSYTPIYTSRIDVIDLRTAAIIASRDQEELFVSFIGKDKALEAKYLEDGTPQLVVLSMSLNN